ncbi:carbonyl reductase [NADPH] 1-like [Uloborus diversus]|uniref:carbonyl reductase [NADPH] 1-like n=1 Tax=Uloborus diversus TaxID=327109 RepID=UPI002409E113|nr:carbonyl reductase [NADPH] 1-like [Uloborus diversus]XP_054713082.1 carbonyl reductase [NADPH] 1-like [Uloborus diversus]
MPKVAVVTGSNKGIGLAIVRGLCKKFDGDVLLTARNEERGRAAVQKLQSEGLNPKFHLLDICCSDSIKILAEYLKKEYGGLDVLVNNAAIAYKNADTAPFSEQAENTIKVNFFATLSVCHELFPLLRPHARVVNVTSSCGKLSFITSNELRQKFLSESLTEDELCNLMNQFVVDAKSDTHQQNGWGNSAYCVSKIGVNALTFMQHRKFLEDPRADIVINAVHPGYVDTDMSSHKGPLTPDQGAEAPIYCALLPQSAEIPRGKFIWNDKKVAAWL